jgi:hemoglobin
VSAATLFDRVGAERLRAVIEDFYDRVFADVMIGFLFTGKDRARLVDKEYELAARMLGADIRYTGKPMREAHARVPILGDHFDRRVQLLTNTLADHDVDPEVRDTWLAHTHALRAQVTADRDSHCDHDAAAARTTVDGAAADKPIGLGKR